MKSSPTTETTKRSPSEMIPKIKKYLRMLVKQYKYVQTKIDQDRLQNLKVSDYQLDLKANLKIQICKLLRKLQRHTGSQGIKKEDLPHFGSHTPT